VAVFEAGVWLGDGYARELRLADGHYEPASLWELELAKDLARRRPGERAVRPHSWLLHLLEARELVAQRQAEQKAIRRRLLQLRARRAGRPPAAAATERAAPEAAQGRHTDRAATGLPPRGHDPRARLLDTLREVL
jgi:hypothetical protein